jgi:two-component system, NtrC family, response regulator HydG
MRKPHESSIGVAPTLDLSSLLESIPEPAILVDGRRVVRGANWRFRARIAGSGGCVGRPCHELSHSSDRLCDHCGEICPLERAHSASRPSHDLHWHTTPIGDGFEEVQSTAIGVANDVSKLTLQSFRALARPTAEAPGQLIGHSVAMLDLRWSIERLRNHSAPIVVRGEMGTERELVARELHETAPSRQGPFVLLPRSDAVASDTVDSELDDEMARSALRALAAAEYGTLFLDRPSAIPFELEHELFAALSHRTPSRRRKGQESRVRWILGATPSRTGDGRVLEPLAALALRLGAAGVTVPPLRQRAGDLPLLISALRPWLVAPCELTIHPFVASALAPLPLFGNLWELRRRLQDGVLNAGSGPLLPQHLPWSS